MATEFYIKEGDTLPVLTATLTDSAAAAIDLTNATTAIMNLTKFRDGNNNTSTGTNVEKTCTFGSPRSGGTVIYTFVAGDWTGGSALTAGRYYVEFEITYSSGAIQTVPNSTYLELVVVADLD